LEFYKQGCRSTAPQGRRLEKIDGSWVKTH
jgi:hypothetical protein